MKLRKKLDFKILVLLCGLSIFNPLNVFANSNLLYNNTEVQTITDGVIYEKSERLYKNGWKDVYVVTVDMTNPNVDFEVLTSTTQHGLKKSVENLTIENNALVGINADFFGSGNPTSSMGQVIIDNKIIEAQNYYNSNEDKYAGVFEDVLGNIFVDYLTSTYALYNSEGAILEIQGKNKITDFSKALYFDRTVFTDTSELDNLNKNLYKVVVQNGVIIHKAGAGEVVDIPTNGFVIVMDQATASSNLAKFNTGDTGVGVNQKYSFTFRPDKSISEIVTGISAGGEILRNGSVVSNGLSISPTSYNPRSAVGVSQDKTKLILIAVDGRGASIGATHNEMASLLLEYGAYDAIHLDGGGSTTLALREEGSRNITTVNNVSDGSSRLVPNAIGIKSTNANNTGTLTSLHLEIDASNTNSTILNNNNYNVNIIGKNEFQNPIDINLNDITLTFKEYTSGSATGMTILPTIVGEHTLIATHVSGVTSEITFKTGATYSYLIPSATVLSLGVGESTQLSLSTANTEGHFKALDFTSGTWTVNDPTLGYFEGDKFIAAGDGVANISVSVDDLTASIALSIGNLAKSIDSFENQKDMYVSYFPNNNTLSGGAGITNGQATHGNNSLLVSYNFIENISTPQVLYVRFDKEPIVLTNNPEFIQMQVKCDGSQNLLKAVLLDANGVSHTVTLIDSMDSNDWVTVNTAIPSSAVAPVSLQQLYVGTLNTTSAESGTIYIDNLEGVSKRNDGGIVVTSYNDPMSQVLKNTIAESHEEDINVFGQTANKPYTSSNSVLQSAINIMNQNATALVFAGSTDLNGFSTGNTSTISWNNSYDTTNTNHLSIINLATKNGSILSENADQWRWFQDYLYNLSKNNILINMDKDIWSTSNSLTGTRENELLHTILKDFVYETGKNVIVVSATSNSTDIQINDGVRYVTLNGLSTASPDNLYTYKYLKLRADENNLRYQICDIY